MAKCIVTVTLLKYTFHFKCFWAEEMEGLALEDQDIALGFCLVSVFEVAKDYDVELCVARMLLLVYFNNVDTQRGQCVADMVDSF